MASYLSLSSGRAFVLSNLQGSTEGISGNRVVCLSRLAQRRSLMITKTWLFQSAVCHGVKSADVIYGSIACHRIMIPQHRHSPSGWRIAPVGVDVRPRVVLWYLRRRNRQGAAAIPRKHNWRIRQRRNGAADLLGCSPQSRFLATSSAKPPSAARRRSLFAWSARPPARSRSASGSVGSADRRRGRAGSNRSPRPARGSSCNGRRPADSTARASRGHCRSDSPRRRS